MRDQMRPPPPAPPTKVKPQLSRHGQSNHATRQPSPDKATRRSPLALRPSVLDALIKRYGAAPTFCLLATHAAAWMHTKEREKFGNGPLVHLQCWDLLEICLRFDTMKDRCISASDETVMRLTKIGCHKTLERKRQLLIRLGLLQSGGTAFHHKAVQILSQVIDAGIASEKNGNRNGRGAAYRHTRAVKGATSRWKNR